MAEEVVKIIRGLPRDEKLHIFNCPVCGRQSAGGIIEGMYVYFCPSDGYMFKKEKENE